MNSGQAKRFLAKKGAIFALRKGRPSHRDPEWQARRFAPTRGFKGVGQGALAGDLETTRDQGLMMRYAVTLTPDDNGTVLVAAPDFPEVVTFGEDRDEARTRAVEAIETAIIGRIAAREDIPRSRLSGGEFVALPALSAAKVELYRAMRIDAVGKAELARRARRRAAACRSAARPASTIAARLPRRRFRGARAHARHRRQESGVAGSGPKTLPPRAFRQLQPPAPRRLRRSPACGGPSPRAAVPPSCRRVESRPCRRSPARRRRR